MRHGILHTHITDRNEMEEELVFPFIRTMRVLIREHARVNIHSEHLASIDDIVTVLTSIQKTRKRHVNTEFTFRMHSDMSQFYGTYDNFPLGHLDWDWRYVKNRRSVLNAGPHGASIRFLIRLQQEPVLYSYRHLTEPETCQTWARVPNRWTDRQYDTFIEVLGKPTLNGWEPGPIEALDLSRAFKRYRRRKAEFTALERTRLDRRTHPLKTFAETHRKQKTDHADVVDLKPPRTENNYDTAVSS